MPSWTAWPALPLRTGSCRSPDQEPSRSVHAPVPRAAGALHPAVAQVSQAARTRQPQHSARAGWDVVISGDVVTGARECVSR